MRKRERDYWEKIMVFGKRMDFIFLEEKKSKLELSFLEKIGLFLKKGKKVFEIKRKNIISFYRQTTI